MNWTSKRNDQSLSRATWPKVEHHAHGVRFGWVVASGVGFHCLDQLLMGVHGLPLCYSEHPITRFCATEYSLQIL